MHMSDLAQNPSISPWWMWTTAIIVGVLSFMSLLGALLGGLFIDLLPELLRILTAEAFTQGPYPMNGTSSEQATWNETAEGQRILAESIRMIEGPEVRRILIMGQVFALLGGLVGAFACYHLYHQDRRGILWTGAWLFVLVLQQSIQSVFSTRLQMQWIEAVDSTANEAIGPSFQWLTIGSSILGILMCGLPAIGVLVLVWMRTDPDQDAVAASGFHHQE